MNSPVMGTEVPAALPVPAEPPCASQGRDSDLWAEMTQSGVIGHPTSASHFTFH